MAYGNRTILLGHIARDPELKYIPSGKAVCRFCVGLNMNYTTAAGEKKTETSFIEVQAWGPTGEVIAKHFRKGNAIYVEGRLKEERWEAKETGEKRSRILVVLDTFSFVTPANDRATASPSGAATAPAPATAAAPPSPAGENGKAAPGSEDDVPF